MQKSYFDAIAVVCALLFALAVCILAAADATSPQGTVDQDLKNLSLEELGNIQVTTVSKEPEEIWNTPAAIYVITQEDIHRSGARSLPDILRLAPGVEVAQLDSSKFSVGIRGFGTRLSRSVLVLIDGRSVYTPLFAGVYWEMQQTQVEDIARIEVIRGPGGTIWGPNAVNGVINIITKRSQDTHGVLVSAGGGNYEQGFLDFRYGGGNTDGFNYRVYGQGFNRGPQFHPDGRNFDDWRSAQFGFRTDWSHGKNDSFTVQGDYYKTISGQKLGVSLFDPPQITNQEANIDLLGQNVLGRWKHRFQKSDIQVQAYWDRTHRADLNFEEVRNTFDLDFIHHINLKRNDFIWGASVRTSPSRYTQVIPTVDFEPHNQAYNLFSGFLQNQFSIVPNRFSITLGSKLEYTSLSGFDAQPSARLLWTPSSHQTVWAAVTRAVRTASRIEDNFQFNALAVPAIPLYIRLIGDGNFVSEKMLGTEFGYRGTLTSKFFIDVATFYNQYGGLLSVENLPPMVETSPTPPHLVLPIFLRNGLDATTMGAELGPVWQPTERLRLRAAYSYVNIDMRHKSWSNDASTIQQTEGSTPHNTLVLEGTANLPKNFDLDLTYRFTGVLGYTGIAAYPKVPSYSTMDARIGWRAGRDFEVSLVGRNLLQPYHFEFAGDPGPLVGIKRSLYVNVVFNRQRQ